MADLRDRVRKARRYKKDGAPLYVRPGTNDKDPWQNGQLMTQGGPLKPRPDIPVTQAQAIPASRPAKGEQGFDQGFKKGKPDFGEIRQSHQGLRGRLQRLKQDFYAPDRENRMRPGIEKPSTGAKPDINNPANLTDEEEKKLDRLRSKLQDLRHARQDFPKEFSKGGKGAGMQGPAEPPKIPLPGRPGLQRPEIELRGKPKRKRQRGSVDV